MMQKSFLVLSLSACYLTGASAFVTPAVVLQKQQGFSPSTLSAASSDAEALMERARKLKAEAETAENELHKNLLEKKGVQNQELDNNIDKLFPQNDDTVDGVVKRLKESHWSTDRLMQIVQRLHDREMAAQGKGRVTASLQGEKTHFDRVSDGNTQESERVQGLIDKLIDAADLIDEEFMKKKRSAKDAIYLNHAELEHWTVGELAKNLRGKVRELRREHEEQFQERLESFNEAQRKKDLPNKTDNGRKQPKP
jgi:hypothetical protein